MKNRTLKKFLATTLLTSMLLITNAGISNAALQANPNTQYTKTGTLANWMKNFRQMETAGGAMGLNETLNSDLTSTESNGIDVHMMKTTEYGAIAILSASGYGNQSNEKNITTTTGNSTGVILDTSKWEWTAGGTNSVSGVNSRYFDKYTTSNASAKIGDALGKSSTTNPGCADWHSASYSTWVADYNPCFRRGSGGIFSFSHDSTDSKYFCRGVAVVGSGL